MQENIQHRFQDIDCNFHFDVLEGNPTKQIINWSKAKEIDLVILGKKHQHSGKGVTSRNIVNIVHCSALFIPEDSDIITKKILIPIDYSEASNVAFYKALELSRVLSVPLTCLHAYEVPSGYHTTGKSFEEFADIICHHSKTDFEQFLKEENISLSELGVEYVLDKHGDPGKIISEYATANQFDMVIIGSKGRTALSSVLLGSVAVKLVEDKLDMPIMVIKTEEANLSLIEAILRL
jgi:nucleotide-binding universal stress UspA family protein